MYTITVLTPTGRRQQVKVTANTTLLQVLEEVCNKHGFNAMKYDLRHHSKILDVSSIFRFTNLPNNAQLEMTEAAQERKESSVAIGMQLETGERLTGLFHPFNTVWDVIITLKPEEAESTNLVAIYMRQEICGRENLSRTTLRSLGLVAGSAMFRLLHKTPEELRFQANITAALPKVTVNEENVKKEPSGSGELFRSKKNMSSENTVTSINEGKNEENLKKNLKTEPSNFKDDLSAKLPNKEKPKNALTENDQRINNPTKCGKNFTSDSVENSQKTKFETNADSQKKTNQTLEQLKEEKKVIILGDRNAIAYNINSVKPVIIEEESDDFFDLTISDAKLLLKQAQQLCAELEYAPLMTSAQRELEKNKRILLLLNQYKKTVLRIKFPDRTVLQGTFSSVETVADVENFVAKYLENSKVRFYLYTTPPKTILDPKSRLIECGCVPSTVIYFGSFDEKTPAHYLKSEVLKKLSTPSSAALMALESREVKHQAVEKSEDAGKRKCSKVVNNAEPGPSGSKEREDRNNSKSPNFKVPKWFKTNK